MNKELDIRHASTVETHGAALGIIRFLFVFHFSPALLTRQTHSVQQKTLRLANSRYMSTKRKGKRVSEREGVSEPGLASNTA